RAGPLQAIQAGLDAFQAGAQIFQRDRLRVDALRNALHELRGASVGTPLAPRAMRETTCDDVQRILQALQALGQRIEASAQVGAPLVADARCARCVDRLGSAQNVRARLAPFDGLAAFERRAFVNWRRWCARGRSW